jgi:hypothetical protein
VKECVLIAVTLEKSRGDQAEKTDALAVRLADVFQDAEKAAHTYSADGRISANIKF